MLLEPPDPHATPARDKLQLVAHADRPVDECAGDHRAEAAHGEDAIDREARAAGVGARLGVVQDAIEGDFEVVEALAREGRDSDDRRFCQRRRLDGRLDLFGHQCPPLIVDKVDLRQCHNPSLDLEQVDDLEVLARLRPHPFIGRDHKNHGVEAVHPRQHVSDEARVTGHVDDPDLSSAGQS